MFRKSVIFHCILSIFCIPLIASQVATHQLDKCLFWANQAEIKEHFTSVREQVKNRWQLFQTNRVFQLFESDKPDHILEEEFENICSTRSFVWTIPGYERAQYLLENDLVRVSSCVAFAYNNTVPYYNASTVCLNNQCYIACEGPRSKDIPNFFDLLTTCRVTHLIRLTDAYEGNTKKCHPYWEGHLSESSDGKQWLNISNENDIYSIRAFDMAYWQDNQGINPEKLLALVLQVRQEVTDSNGLLLIHCSAGVGRTGTFLAAIAIVDAIDRGEPFSIEEIVYKLSLQRVYSVGRYSQYITLHRLAERYLRESHENI